MPENSTSAPVKTAEELRLGQAREKGVPWRQWGPYLSERQWGTVREDYSENGDTWDYFSHDQARSRAYHWGEDGLAGLSDDRQRLCFSIALWNGKDPILKERVFGLTNSEANHGEDVKEYYFYLDSTPTHSYMKYLYKYPQNQYPYLDLIDTNRRRSRTDPEYELLDTSEDRYFDIFVEYAKASPTDILIQVSVCNRGPDESGVHVLPTLWFRNIWTWWPDEPKPSLRNASRKSGTTVIAATDAQLGDYFLYCQAHPDLLCKNHLGDRDEFLPKVHGFDEFFGNLYHLNAEEEPENPDYPKNPEFRKRFGPRGVLRSWAQRDGTQKIEDTGPLTRKRIETIDDEITAGALDFIERQHKAGKPFFCWWNSTRMHVFTHLKPESAGKTGLGVYPDGMIEHDSHVGQLLAKLDELGIADNTIVMYSTDNGAEELSWPDGGTTPFRGEKDTNWEGGWRVPCAIRWPGVIKAGSVYNEVFSHQDILPTLLAAAGEPDIVEKVKNCHQTGAKSYKAHLDGFNLIPFLKGEVKENPRPGFLYWSDEGDLMALRYGDWKVHFVEQRAEGVAAWQEPFVPLRLLKLFNLRSDPFENADIASDMFYSKWRADRLFMLLPAGALVQQWVKTLAEFPPRQRPEHWSVGDVLEKLQQNARVLETSSGGGVK